MKSVLSLNCYHCGSTLKSLSYLQYKGSTFWSSALWLICGKISNKLKDFSSYRNDIMDSDPICTKVKTVEELILNVFPTSNIIIRYTDARAEEPYMQLKELWSTSVKFICWDWKLLHRDQMLKILKDLNRGEAVAFMSFFRQGST